MSFCRWGAESALYIFDHSGLDAVVCFACLFSEGDEDYPTEYAFTSLSKMLEHVQRHRDAGHDVLPNLEDKLRERWEYDE